MSTRGESLRSSPDSGPERAARQPTREYWDGIADAWSVEREGRSWRLVSDAVNARLLRRWLPAGHGGSVLKTDLFDEIAGRGLIPILAELFDRVAGIDISPALIESVRARFPRIEAETADVRALPFPANSFDVVVSNSTLDHFETRDDITSALLELHRVTRRGGSLLVTFDNPVNPVVAIRNAMPHRLRSASGLVPFAVGPTCGPRQLRAVLKRTGFDVVKLGAVFHCPRIVVVLGGHLIDRQHNAALKRLYARIWTVFEGLAFLPTRFLTGYFVAALARKR